MTEKPGIDNDSRVGRVEDPYTAGLRTNQVRDEVKNAIASLETKGIKDWEILNAWSEIAFEQGNYLAATTLATAAIERGKPPE